MSLRISNNSSKSGHSVKTSALRSHNLASSDKLSSSVSGSSKRGLVPLHPTSTWLFLRLSVAYAVAPAAESVIMESVHFVRAAPTKCSVGPREESKKLKEKGLIPRTVNVKTINPSTENVQTWRFKRSACRVDIIRLLVSLRGNATLRVECTQATTGGCLRDCSKLSIISGVRSLLHPLLKVRRSLLNNAWIHMFEPETRYVAIWTTNEVLQYRLVPNANSLSHCT